MKSYHFFVLLFLVILFAFSCHYLICNSLPALHKEEEYQHYIYTEDRDTSWSAHRKLSRGKHSEEVRQFNSTKSTEIDNYALSLVEKDRLRKAFLQKWIATQEELRLHPTNSTRYVIFSPTYAGLGNTLAVLAEAIVISWVTNRRLRSIFILLELL